MTVQSRRRDVAAVISVVCALAWVACAPAGAVAPPPPPPSQVTATPPLAPAAASATNRQKCDDSIRPVPEPSESIQWEEPVRQWAPRAPVDLLWRTAGGLLQMEGEHHGTATLRLLRPKVGIVWASRIQGYGESVQAIFHRTRGRMYISRHPQVSFGCTLHAVDLATGAVVWELGLRGVGAAAHSAYHNDVHVRLVGDDLIVFGHETYGRYIEVVDTLTGKTKAHRIVSFRYRLPDPPCDAVGE